MFSGKTVRLSAENGIPQAAEILRAGGTVAFPTETVYGLGANAFDATAVAKIFEAKDRPGWDPVIVHVRDREMLERVAEVTGGLAAKVEALMAAFWPGPLTLLLPRTAAVPDSVTAGRLLVGVRMPAHSVALELIRTAGVPVAAPSANRFGRTSPTTAAHVLEDLDGRIDAVLDGGATRVFAGGALEAVAPESLPSPGVGLRHYAPRARLVLVESEAEMRETVVDLTDSGERVGVMLPDGWDPGLEGREFRWAPWGNREALARRLFAGLRELDEAGVSVIVCPVPEAGGLGDALRDRLRKAARVK